MGFTKAQEEAIKIDKENCLVAAAAGSGKTSVLSNRVVRLLTDADNPVDANDIIVATFTKASAAEMIHRISKVLTEKIDVTRDEMDNETDNNKIAILDKRIEYYEVQKLQLPTARISTIDSLCKSLVQENFQTLDISSNTKLANQTQIAILENDVITELFEDLHSGDSTVVSKDDFKSLIEFTCTKNDSDLIEMLYKLHGYIRSFPYPLDYLDEVLAMYQNEKGKSIDDSIWISDIKAEIFATVEHSLRLATQANEINDGDSDRCAIVKEKYGKQFEDCFVKIKAVSDLSKTGSLKDVYEAVKNLTFEKLSSITKTSGADMSQKDKYKGFFDKAKEIKNLVDEYGSIFIFDYAKDIDVLIKQITTLFALLKVVYANVEAKKRELELMDFTNIEHYTLELLTKKNEAGGYDKTDIAVALSNQFKYILVDECQDINRVQNEIFKFLSDNEENIFMVGDVKQSIYRFRKAAPELFIEKRKSSATKTIVLQENFRSRDVVCNVVNHIFSKLMSEKIGEIDYNAVDEAGNYTEQLVVGRKNYVDNPDALPELHILNCGEEISKYKLEAQHIAKTIKNMIDSNYQVFHKENETRDCRAGDFAILVRSTGANHNFKELYTNALQEHDITLSCEFQNEFLKQYEVLVATNLLKVINNPLQNVPLLSVLMSPLFGFSPDLISIIKLKTKGKYLWNSIRFFSEQKTQIITDSDGNTVDNDILQDTIADTIEDTAQSSDILKELGIDIDAKTMAKYEQDCRNFVDLIAIFREKAASTTVGKLVQYVFDSTDFLELMSAKVEIDKLKSNMNYLLNDANEFSNFSGLPGFVNYIDNLVDNKQDIEVSNSVLSDNDAVKLITIHKSKGLEFPICFVASCSKKFNKRDLSKKYIYDTELGLALTIVSENKYQKHNPISYIAIAEKLNNALLSEELRLLYVALTRTSEKLIMVSAYKNAEKTLDKIIQTKDAVTPNEVAKCAGYGDWLMLAMLRGVDIPSVGGSTITDSYKVSVIDCSNSPIAEETTEEETTGSVELTGSLEPSDFEETTSSTDFIKTIQEQMDFEYPDKQLTLTTGKTTVTKLAKKDLVAEQGAFKVVNLKSKLLFDSEVDTKGKEGLTAAQKGTILHAFMEYCDFGIACNNAENEIKRLVDENYLTQTEADSLNRDEIDAFFNSTIYKELICKAGVEVKRELKFNFFIPATMLNPNLPDDCTEQVFVQGIADCLVFDGDTITIIDYKTDRARETDKEDDKARMREQYKIQMVLYAKAMRDMFGKDVKAALYSLALGEHIDVDVSE